MAEAEEENQPLLVNVQSDACEIRQRTPRQKLKRLYESDQVLGRHGAFSGQVLERGGINVSPSASLQSLQQAAEADHIVAIFVVAFDTKAGTWVYYTVTLTYCLFALGMSRISL